MIAFTLGVTQSTIQGGWVQRWAELGLVS